MSTKKKRRSTWTRAQGVARFTITTAQASSVVNPSLLTDSELVFLFDRRDAAISALWCNEVHEQHVIDVCEALNVTQALVDAGAAQEHAEAVKSAIYAGAALRDAWKTYSPGNGKALASVEQIEAIQAGLEVYGGILSAGLYGHELLQAMDIVRLRQRSGQILDAKAGRHEGAEHAHG